MKNHYFELKKRYKNEFSPIGFFYQDAYKAGFLNTKDLPDIIIKNSTTEREFRRYLVGFKRMALSPKLLKPYLIKRLKEVGKEELIQVVEEILTVSNH